VEKEIAEIKNWLELNEGQSFLPTMDMDDLLHKKEVAHKKEVLEILFQIITETWIEKNCCNLLTKTKSISLKIAIL
jgi:hypothetical protein